MCIRRCWKSILRNKKQQLKKIQARKTVRACFFSVAVITNEDQMTVSGLVKQWEREKKRDSMVDMIGNLGEGNPPFKRSIRGVAR